MYGMTKDIPDHSDRCGRRPCRWLEPLLADKPCEVFKGTVIGLFGGFIKETCGQFARTKMVLNAIATYTFSGTWFVGAVAAISILFFFTVHCLSRAIGRVCNECFLQTLPIEL